MGIDMYFSLGNIKKFVINDHKIAADDTLETRVGVLEKIVKLVYVSDAHRRCCGRPCPV